MVQMRKWRPLLNLEGSETQASYRRIVEGLVTAIVDGRLTPGTLLPGTREMARLLDVNRKTVILAYEEAMTKGWLVSEARRGTFVNAQLAPIATARNAPPNLPRPTLSLSAKERSRAVRPAGAMPPGAPAGGAGQPGVSPKPADAGK